MGCYTMPLLAAMIHYSKRNDSKHHKWLHHLLLGGAIFGVVDHAWNNELLLFSWADIGLGVLITATIFLAWGLMVWNEKSADSKATA